MIYSCPAHDQTGCRTRHLYIPFIGYLRLWPRGCFGWFSSPKDWKTQQRLMKLTRQTEL